MSNSADAKPDERNPMSASASVARHPRPPELVGATLEDIAARYVARFRERKADWAAFEDAKLEGYKRAQHRFIGAGGSGKHADAAVIPPRAFTLSIMYVEPGQGNAAHTHEVEECFFVLQGYLTAFIQDESGRRLDIRLGARGATACRKRGAHAPGGGLLFRPAGLSHCFHPGGERPAARYPPRALGVHRLPAGRDPRLCEREPGAGVFPGHARKGAAGGDRSEERRVGKEC